jgi:hypothetical protein
MPSEPNSGNVTWYSKDRGGFPPHDTSIRPIVRLGSVSSGCGFPIVNDCSWGTKTLSVTAAGTVSVVAAGGASINTRVLGFSLCNEGTAKRRYKLLFGTTAFWMGSLMGGGVPYNFNLVNIAPKALNSKVVLYANGATTATCTVYYQRA